MSKFTEFILQFLFLQTFVMADIKEHGYSKNNSAETFLCVCLCLSYFDLKYLRLYLSMAPFCSLHNTRRSSFSTVFILKDNRDVFLFKAAAANICSLFPLLTVSTRDTDKNSPSPSHPSVSFWHPLLTPASQCEQLNNTV